MFVIGRDISQSLPDVLNVFVFVAVALLGRSSEVVRLYYVTAPLKYGARRFYAQRKNSRSI
jgi:hypothetical protein